MPEAGHRTSILKSVDRTLDVLELLSKKGLVGVIEVADALKVANSTAHRILTTLEKKGFAVQDSKTSKYALGHMVFYLARSVIHMIEPMKYVRPYLDELRDNIGENVAFGIVNPSKDKMLILAETVADKVVIAKPILFEHFPVHACACGKAYLLTLNDQQLKALLPKNRLTRFTKHTYTSLPMLKKQLAKFRALRYTLSRDEFSVGLSTMASSIYDIEDQFAGAIIVAGPTFRFTDKNIKSWAKLLLQTTARMNLELKARGGGSA